MNAIEEYLVNKNRMSYARMVSGHYIPRGTESGISCYPALLYSKDADPAHRMDMYCPQEDRSLPVVMYVHGDLQAGTKELSRHFCMHLCRLGFMVFSVNYRLFPEADIPEQLQDLDEAEMTVRKMSRKFHMQADNLFMMGDGAGAMLIYYLQAARKDPELARLLGIRPEPIPAAAIACISGPVFEKAYRQRTLGIRFRRGERYRGSPYLRTDDPALLELQPPGLYFTGRQDPGHKELMTLLSSHRAGVCEVTEFSMDPNYYTGFSIMDPELPESQEVMKQTAEFFLKWRINKTY